ncbi:MAG: methyltransferase domain-containing protein [Verrucomicrobiales bacterium]|nr:methyltransferase domain-containing protein [Verrucomicrobiales bacterium]MCP5559304.1 methyltransferase domain-containing protein [Verrucomicrobiaceae bacterium]
MAERPRQFSEAEFDSHAAAYDAELMRGLAVTGESKDYFAEGRVRWLSGRLRLLGISPKDCLDFGCGTGGGRRWLMEGLGLAHYVGYDPSAASLEIAAGESVGLTNVAWTDEVEKLPVGELDLAFCNGVFHHIPPTEREAAVGAIWKALRPGGLFALWENNRWNPIVHWMMSRVPFDKDAQMLFPHQARQLLANTGFQVVLTEYFFIFPALLKALRPLEAAFCKLPLGGQYMVLVRKPEDSR